VRINAEVETKDRLSRTATGRPPTSEPETYAMLPIGLGLLSRVGRRKKMKEAAAA